jgi:redox-sensitive bicupin YhaK (pirin superfamily)
MVFGTESHKDTLGMHENYKAGDVQLISSGSGLYHEGGNVSDTEPARHLQIWVAPKVLNLEPKVSVKKSIFSNNALTLLVSPGAELASLKINQDVWIYKGDLESGNKINYKVQEPGNGVMIYLITGEIELNSRVLKQESTAFIADQDTMEIISNGANSSFVLIEIVR